MATVRKPPKEGWHKWAQMTHQMVATCPRSPGCPGIVLGFFSVLENVLELGEISYLSKNLAILLFYVLENVLELGKIS